MGNESTQHTIEIKKKITKYEPLRVEFKYKLI